MRQYTPRALAAVRSLKVPHEFGAIATEHAAHAAVTEGFSALGWRHGGMSGLGTTSPGCNRKGAVVAREILSFSGDMLQVIGPLLPTASSTSGKIGVKGFGDLTRQQSFMVAGQAASALGESWSGACTAINAGTRISQPSQTQITNDALLAQLRQGTLTGSAMSTPVQNVTQMGTASTMGMTPDQLAIQQAQTALMLAAQNPNNGTLSVSGGGSLNVSAGGDNTTTYLLVGGIGLAALLGFVLLR